MMNGQFEGLKFAFYMTSFFVIGGIVMSIGANIGDYISDLLNLKDTEEEKSKETVKQICEELEKEDKKLDSRKRK